jgi:hypothetical protein
VGLGDGSGLGGAEQGSRQVGLTVLLAIAFALAACGRQSPATQAPDPPSWFVGEEDRTTPDPPLEREPSLAVGDSAFAPATLVVEAGEAVRMENTGTGTVTFILDGAEVAVVEPGESRVVSIDLEPGRHAISSREDPSVTGTLVVT